MLKFKSLADMYVILPPDLPVLHYYMFIKNIDITCCVKQFPTEIQVNIRCVYAAIISNFN